MDPWLVAVLVVVGILAALVAYGSWLIGQDSAAEADARQMSNDSEVLSAGWSSLDLLRSARLPVVQAIEDYLEHLKEVLVRVLGDGDKEGGER